MKIEIPGYKELDLRYVLLDFNGTIAVDGKISLSAKLYLNRVAEKFMVYVLTADTNHNASQECDNLPVNLIKYTSSNVSSRKLAVLQELGPEYCVAIGNGRNDFEMLKNAALSISVLEEEGMYSPLLFNSDICTKSIIDALTLLLEEHRLVANLRG